MTPAEMEAGRQTLAQRRNLRVLRDLAKHYEHLTALNENGPDYKAARHTDERAAAIKWALLQLDPMTEGPRQILDEMAAQ